MGIARALVTNPEIMLWDEPTASLDPILVGEVLEVMEELVKETGTTMVIVTHEVSFALRAAHRIVFMDRGKVVEEGRAPRSLCPTPLGDSQAVQETADELRVKLGKRGKAGVMQNPL